MKLFVFQLLAISATVVAQSLAVESGLLRGFKAQVEGPAKKATKTTKKAATAADTSNAWGCGRNNDQPKTCCKNPCNPVGTVWAQCGECDRGVQGECDNIEVKCPFGEVSEESEDYEEGLDDSEDFAEGCNTVTCCYNSWDPTRTVWAQCGRCGGPNSSNVEVACNGKNKTPEASGNSKQSGGPPASKNGWHCCYNQWDPTKTVWAQKGQCATPHSSNIEVPCNQEEFEDNESQ